MPRALLYVLALCVLALCLGASVPEARAQEEAVPVAVQYPLLMKVLAFENSLAEAAGADLVVGVVYQRRYRTSQAFLDDVVGAHAGGGTVRGRPVRLVPLDVSDRADLAARVEAEGVDVLYVAPLRAFDLAEITAVSRQRGLITMGAVPAYVSDGVAVGIGLDGSRPRILVNTASATAEGARFSGRLLQLAHRIDP